MRDLNAIQRYLRQPGQYADISLSHITPDDVALLNRIGATPSEPVPIGKTAHGFIIRLLWGQPKEDIDFIVSRIQALGFSQEFICLWLELHNAGFGLVCLDPLGEVIENLPRFAG